MLSRPVTAGYGSTLRSDCGPLPRGVLNVLKCGRKR